MQEQLIGGNPEAFVDYTPDDWADDETAFSEEIRNNHREQFHNPDKMLAICEQYRAAATFDVEADDANRGHKVSFPVLALWSESGSVGISPPRRGPW